MGPGTPDSAELDRFFQSLSRSVRRELASEAGAKYDRLLYAVSFPYRDQDFGRVLDFVGHSTGGYAHEAVLVSALQRLPYPVLARAPLAESDPHAWSAILHFHDPSYPLYTAQAKRSLRRLGYGLSSSSPYVDYVAAVDDLKERCPAWAVPETHWFLARLLQVGLHAWARPVPSLAEDRDPIEVAAAEDEESEGFEEC